MVFPHEGRSTDDLHALRVVPRADGEHRTSRRVVWSMLIPPVSRARSMMGPTQTSKMAQMSQNGAFLPSVVPEEEDRRDDEDSEAPACGFHKPAAVLLA